jgi:hypothetical protein
MLTSAWLDKMHVGCLKAQTKYDQELLVHEFDVIHFVHLNRPESASWTTQSQDVKIIRTK